MQAENAHLKGLSILILFKKLILDVFSDSIHISPHPSLIHLNYVTRHLNIYVATEKSMTEIQNEEVKFVYIYDYSIWQSLIQINYLYNAVFW